MTRPASGTHRLLGRALAGRDSRQPARGQLRAEAQRRRAAGGPRRRASPRPARDSGPPAPGPRGRASEASRRRGRPLWARPRTSPSRRSAQSCSASTKPSFVLAHGGQAHGGDAVVGTSATRTQNDSALPRPDAPAQLVQLREAEAVGVEDDHHRRLGHVDADLHDGRAHQHVELAVAEARHLGVPLVGPEAAVDEADPQRRQRARAAGRRPPPRPAAAARRRLPARRRRRQARPCAGPSRPRVALVGLRVDVGHDHERAVPGRGLLAHLLPGARQVGGLRMPVRVRTRPAGAARRSETSRSA